jgi:FkbM family methyltransferase
VQAPADFEPNEKAYIREHLAKTDRFVDVGANIGLYTCIAAAKGVPVVAVEPSAQNVALLLENLELNALKSEVVVLPVALSATEGGALRLYNEGTGASLIPGWAQTGSLFSVAVPLTSLDVLCRGWVRTHEQVLIKIDVEGAELSVLEGATATLARVPRPRWLVEINFTAHHPGGRHPAYAAVFEHFWEAGYSCTDVGTGREVTSADVNRWVASGIQDFGQGGNFAFA